MNFDFISNIDFASLASNECFKEDSVREVILLPIFEGLGYVGSGIERSKTLEHPFLKIGSNKKIPIKLIPDYSLRVGDRFAWVLDAKSPQKSVNDPDYIAQVYSYATHPEINSNYFAISNGIEFCVYRTHNYAIPVLQFHIAELEHYWERLYGLLSPQSFKVGKTVGYESVAATSGIHRDFDYLNRPLLDEIPVKKRAAKRHFGVHGYFTKQTWNVVQEYIRNFSQPGDMVLDPFGGSGVTAVEAAMMGRKAISVDLNPMPVFIVNSLVQPVDFEKLVDAFYQVKEEYLKKEPKSTDQIEQALAKYPYPKGWKLPQGSDVDTVEKLFSQKQLAQLGLLKHIIKKQKDKAIQNSLLLMFSGLLTKINLTYHTSTYVKKDGGGNSSAFQYYRYRLAPEPVELDVMTYFELRFKKVLEAKREMKPYINAETIENIQIVKGSATNLDFIKKESVDYIYTDPPYGNKIPYLDLSVMWNAWLDLPVSEEDYKQEAIEGGEQAKSKNEYNQLIAESIREMYRVLKFDRWLSFVFAHKDPEFWHLIIDTAEACGFEYIGAVPQKNGQTSFKKRQNPFTVLSGQLIINFKKVRNPKAIMKANLGMDISQAILETIEGVIAKYDGATLEQINDELIIKGLELGFLDLLKKEYSDLSPILKGNFDYDEKREIFRIKKNTKFKTHIDVRLRIRYYLLSYMRRLEKQGKYPDLDEIVLDIIPLLKNGVTPENQTILNVLEDIAIRIDGHKWKLKGDDPQLKLF